MMFSSELILQQPAEAFLYSHKGQKLTSHKMFEVLPSIEASFPGEFISVYYDVKEGGRSNHDVINEWFHAYKIQFGDAPLDAAL